MHMLLTTTIYDARHIDLIAPRTAEKPNLRHPLLVANIGYGKATTTSSWAPELEPPPRARRAEAPSFQ